MANSNQPGTRDNLNKFIVEIRDKISEETQMGKIALSLLDIIERMAGQIEEEEFLLAEDLKEFVTVISSK